MSKVNVTYEDMTILETDIEAAEAMDWDDFFFRFSEDTHMFRLTIPAAKKLLQHLQIQYACNPVHVHVEMDSFLQRTIL